MSQQITCIDSSMLCTAVASPCQTLRELLAAETTNAYKGPNIRSKTKLTARQSFVLTLLFACSL